MNKTNTKTESNFEKCFKASPVWLTDGAVGVRLRSEFGLIPDEHIGNAGLLYKQAGIDALRMIYRQYIDIATEHHLPIIVSTPTQRSSHERIAASRYSEKPIILDTVNFLKDVRSEYPGTEKNIFIAGLMGCRGDAYNSIDALETNEAFDFHSLQTQQFIGTGVDLLFASVMPAIKEAIGMALAMEDAGLPYIISFMIRENGALIDGTPISEAIRLIDAATKRRPICYMANCVHPIILQKALSNPLNKTPFVMERFRGLQANASALRPEELDGSEYPIGDLPDIWAGHMIALREQWPFKIFGGCCGTNQRHMAEIARLLEKGK